MSLQRFSPAPEGAILALTGASAGLGRALTLAWSRPGARMVLCARREGPLLEIAALAKERGADVRLVVGSVADGGLASRVRETAQGAFGAVTHLVTNASSLGEVPLTLVSGTSDAAWREAIEVNLLGTVRLWQEVLPAMEEVIGGGRVLTISSDAAVTGYPGWGAYGATKSAVDQLVRILAAEFTDYGIDHVKVWAVDPGDMDTALHEAAIPGADRRELARPEAVAPVLVDLLASEVPPASGRYTLDEVRAKLALGPVR